MRVLRISEQSEKLIERKWQNDCDDDFRTINELVPCFLHGTCTDP
jgi:hypothetical protein